MRKIIGLIFILLSIILGTFIIMSYLAFAGGTYYGYLGYCSYLELPYFMTIWIGSLFITLLLIIYYIYLETFLKFNEHKKIYPYLIFALLTVLGFIVYNIWQFPFLKRSFGIVSQSAEQVELYNPLIGVGILYSFILSWLIIRFKLKTRLFKKLFVLAYFLIALSILTIAIIYLNAEYEVCRG